jgi:predicted ArsR family transcriptional regulator
LNQLHYQARWEAGAEGPRIILGQCPYAAVIGNHPELCRMDMSLLEGMLDTQVEQRVKLGPMCIFLVG